MFTERVNSWDYEDETLAWKMCDRYRSQGKVSWVKDTTVYWIEESTD